MSKIFGNKSDCTYTSCYCEENIWKLCKSLEESGSNQLENCDVIFISNSERKIPLWKQAAGGGFGGPVVWDYHVLLIHRQTPEAVVYDLDSLLPFPTPLRTYVRQAIRHDPAPSMYHRFFRVIPAREFLAHFASDRSHMLKDEIFTSPPPEYPCIQTAESMNNIQDFISMDPAAGIGSVCDLTCFKTLYGVM